MRSTTPLRFQILPPLLLGGLRRRHDFSATEQELAEQWREFLAQDDLPGRVGPRYYGVMCGADATSFEYMCGVEVESLADLPEGRGRMRVPAQRYAIFAHHGSAATLRGTWQEIFAWLASGDYQSAHLPDFEVYEKSPLDMAEGIEVWVGVVQKREGQG